MSRSENYKRYNDLADIIQRDRLNWRTAGTSQSILNRLNALEDEIYANTRIPRSVNVNIAAQSFGYADFARMVELENRLGLVSNINASDSRIPKRLQRLEKKLRFMNNRITDIYEEPTERTYNEFQRDLKARNLARKTQQIIVYNTPIKMYDFVSKETTILQTSPHIRFSEEMTFERAVRLLELYVRDYENELMGEYEMRKRTLVFSATLFQPTRQSGLVDTMGFTYRIIPITRNMNVREIPLYDFRAGWYYSLGKHTTLDYVSNNKCCVDVIMNHLAGKDRFKKLMCSDIQLSSNTINGVCEWLRDHSVGFNIRDAFYNEIMHEPSKNPAIPMLYAMVNNEHIYLINNEEQKKKFRAGKYDDFEINWDSEHSVYKCSEGNLDFTYQELIKFQKETKTGLSIFIVEDLRNIHNKEHYTDLSKLIEYIYMQERLICVNISGSINKTVQFTYMDVVVLYNSEYNDVQDVIRGINKSNPVNEITYCNQSMAEIGMELFTNVSFVPKSCFNNLLRAIFYNPAIWKDQCYRSDEFDSLVDYKTFDINKAHTFALLDRDEDQYIFDYTDSPVKYMGGDILAGYYEIRNNYGIKLGPFDFGQSFVFRSKKVIRLLEMGSITKENIVSYIKPSRSYSNSKMTDFVKYVYGLDIAPKHQKNIINSFIGLLGKWKTSSSQGICSNSVLTAFSLFDDGKINDIRFSDTSDLLYLSKQEKTKLPESYRNIYHDITVDTCFNLYDMYMSVKTDKSRLLAYNTDSITITFPRDDIKLSREIGGYKIEHKELKPNMSLKSLSGYRDDEEWGPDNYHIDLDEFIISEDGYLIIGKAGRSKTYTLCNTIIPELNANNKKWIALGFSHQVVKNMNSYANTENRCCTIASFFNDVYAGGREANFWKKCARTMNKDTYVLVDEIYAVSKKDFCLLYKLFLTTQCKFILCGDNNQLAGIDIAPIDYDQTCIIKEMCRRRIILTKKFRFDDELDLFANKIIAGSSVDFTQIMTIPLKVNLCFTHKMRKRVNLECMKFYRGNNYLTIPENKSVATSQEVYLSVGCSIVSITNSDGLHNRDRFIVKEWDSEKITCTGESGDIVILIEEFHDKFLVGYCNTIHSSQCMTIAEDIGLFELERYSRRMVYTAITRVKNLKQIYTSVKYNNMIFPVDDLGFKTIEMKEDEAGFIYELYDGNTIYYVGICKDVEEMKLRMNSNSKNLLNRTIKKLGYDVNVRVVKEVPVYRIVKIDKIQMRYINQGHPIIVDDIMKKRESVGKIDSTPVENKTVRLLGSVSEIKSNGKIAGYVHEFRKVRTRFYTGKYNGLDEAKKACLDFQLEFSMSK